MRSNSTNTHSRTLVAQALLPAGPALLPAQASAASLLAAILLTCAFQLSAASTPVTLNPATTPTSGDAGITLVSVTGTGFPSGTIAPNKVNVTLKPAVTGPPTATTKAIKVKVVSGSTETVTFRIPMQLIVPTATGYNVSIVGSTSTGATFHSVNTAALTINGTLTITTTSPLPTATVGMNYSQTLAAAGGTGTYTWSITSGSLPAGLTLNASTGQIIGQPTASGMASFTATVKDGDTATASAAFTMTIDPALMITSTSPLPPATVGANYSVTLTATGGSGVYTWSITTGALPAGLTLNASTGQITGQPTASGMASFTATVKDTAGASASAPFTFTINPALMITTTSPLPQATVGTNYSVTLTATGGSGIYTWSITTGSLPAGLTLNASTGQITGQPATSGTASFTATVKDTTGASASAPFTLTINPPLTITTTSPLPQGTVGTNYSVTLTATGGSGAYTWSITSGTLPAGLSLASSTGIISGTPTIAVGASFTAQVTDSNSVTASQQFSLTVVNPPPALQSLSPNSGYQGLSLQVAISGSYTNFVQGTTTATFGPGTSVGGSKDGAPGPVIVTSPTTATAQVTIGPAATTGSQTVTITTGGEQVSLANGFTILAAIPYITVQTSAPKPLATGFSGFNDANVIHGVEYNDPKFEAMVLPLKPGFIRYPGGSDSLAFEWEAAHENHAWFTHLMPYLTTNQIYGLTRASFLGQAKGGVCFTSTPPGTCYSNFSELASYVGANALVCFNGYTDNDTNSPGNMVAAAQTAGLNVIEWEIGNEPYAYPLFFPTPSSYAGAEAVYDHNFVSADASATIGLFYQGPFSAVSSSYQTWDQGMSTYSPSYWNAVSTHVYPINTTVTTAQEEAELNSVLGYATDAYVVSYLDPLIGPTTPIFITELSADTLGTVNFETYLYYGVFLAEYISRMSTVPNVKGVAVQALYLGNLYQQGIIRAVNDFETYLINNVMANSNYSTNTATDPNTQFQFYYSAGGVALQVANLAINSSNAVWPTAVYGNIPTVPTATVQGYGGPPIPAVFAQGYQAIDGSHYLLITNKSNQSFQFAIIVNGSLLEQTLNTTYVSNPSDTAANTATSQNTLQVMTGTSANPVTIGPYSVTAVHW